MTKNYQSPRGNDIYRDLSDEELSELLIHANEEHRRRQEIRYTTLVQSQLDETKRLKKQSMNMYMDFSETEEEKVGRP